MEMFYKTTFLLLIYNFATVLASTEFGCKFKRRGGYEVPRPDGASLWPEAVWGEKSPPPLLVGSRADLILFQAKIQQAREKVFKEHLFDQARPYLTMLYNMPDSKKNIFHGKGGGEFERWFADYQPRVNRRQDELGIMMLIMNQLSEYCKGTRWANVKESSFFAAVRRGVDYKEIKRLDVEHWSQPPKEKDIKELIGVIQVVVGPIPGYILIDLDYNMEGALFINKPWAWEEYTQFATVKSPFSMENKHVTIKIIGQDKGFIHLSIDSGNATSNPSSSDGPTNPMGNPTPAQKKPPPTSKLIYVDRPLCSFLRTANVMMRNNPVITYGKLNAQGDMLAYVLTRFPEDFDSPFCKSMDSQDTFCAGYLTTDKSTNEKKLVERTFSSFQNMSPDDKQFLQTVVNKMITYPFAPVDNQVMEQLTKLDTHMIEYKKENRKCASWNAAKHQAAKVKGKLPSLCGRVKD